jgi:hypothetical protein
LKIFEKIAKVPTLYQWHREKDRLGALPQKGLFFQS